MCVAVLYSAIRLHHLGEKKIAPKKTPEHYWNTLEVQVVQGVADAFVEQVVNTGVAVGQKRIMLIKRIIMAYGGVISATRAPGISTEVFASLDTRQGLAAMPALGDNGSIYFHALVNMTGGDGATAAESPAALSLSNGFPPYVEFDDPVPVADDVISLYFDTSGMSAVATLVAKIYYAIATVTLEEALTILESYR